MFNHCLKEEKKEALLRHLYLLRYVCRRVISANENHAGHVKTLARLQVQLEDGYKVRVLSLFLELSVCAAAGVSLKNLLDA